MIKQHFKDLIAKYLSGSAAPSEQRLVDEYLIKLERNDTEMFDEEGERMLKESMWEQIQLRTKPIIVPVVSISWYKSKRFRSIAVAASILLAIGLSVFFFTGNPQKPEIVSTSKKNATDSGTVTVLHHEINTTGKVKTIVLPDGSSIVLEDKGELVYSLPFIDRRDFTLIGKAFFKVAKDKTKPFTIKSGAISTTALGTEFTVTAFKAGRYITVRLYEGKVVVKALDQDNKKMKSDVYLLPGQELLYGGPTVVVRKFGSPKDAARKQTTEKDIAPENPSIPENTKNPFFMFNNRPLEEVFDQLAEMYNVKVIYDKKDVKNLYFIGRYNSSTSIETILNRIATLNNLTITKQDDAFIVSK